jgi:hypothetical protein
MSNAAANSLNLKHESYDTAALPLNDDEVVVVDDLVTPTYEFIHNFSPSIEEASPQRDNTVTLRTSLVSEPNIEIMVEKMEDTTANQVQRNDYVVFDPAGISEIWVPDENDVLTGRGASINLHPGNQKFRALCYANKAIFDDANHAAKKRIATDIWSTCQRMYSSRFLSKRNDQGPWLQQSSQSAILKVAQTIRDYQRPDRIIQRKLQISSNGNDSNGNHTSSGTSNHRRRSTMPVTPMDNVTIIPLPQHPILENPDGVETNDILCGRGAVSYFYFRKNEEMF